MTLLIINRLQMFIIIKLGVQKKDTEPCRNRIQNPVGTVTLLKRLVKTAKEKAELLEDLFHKHQKT